MAGGAAVSTNHFSQLTEAEQERLAILVEECAEVQQIACKILRHGYKSRNPKIPGGETNREALEREVGDLLHAADRMWRSRDIDRSTCEDRMHSKADHVTPYLHHQEAAP
jgi:hypothetical protein